MKWIKLNFFFALIGMGLLVYGCAPPPAAATPALSAALIASPTAAATVTLTPPAFATPQGALATPEPLPATPSATLTPAILIGAGDISYCGKTYLGDDQTAQLLARLMARYPQAHIFTAGDNVQSEGLDWEYRDCFGPTWGRWKERIHPAPGNHDWMTANGAPYFQYFGAAAGQPDQGFYSYDLNGWHIVTLNSNCDQVACGEGSVQVTWLRQDLQTHPAACTLLVWHIPRWSSGLGGGLPSVDTFWRIANEFGAEVVVNGHEHDYERFAPQDAAGQADTDGVRQFIAGTGGAPERPWGKILPNSEARSHDTWGVLVFSLFPSGYSWQFEPVEGGQFSDAGSGECH